MAAQHDVTRDCLVECCRLQAVGARQIDHAKSAPGPRSGETTFLALDGDARIVGNLLAAAGETIEECGLAAVRDADEGETDLRRGQCRGRRGVHGPDPARDTANAAPRASASAHAPPERCNSINTCWASRRRNASVV